MAMDLPAPPGFHTPPPLPPPPVAQRRTGLLVVALVLMVVAFVLPAAAVLVAPPGEHAFLEQLPDGSPYRWNPCQPVHYLVNERHRPAGSAADIREAIDRVSSATGIRFVDDGSTVITVDQQIGASFQANLPDEPRYLPLLIAFVPEDHFTFLTDGDHAIAFGLPARGDGDLAHEYVSGVVAIDADQGLPAGFGSRYSMGPVLMHELAHVMGLGHVGSAHELMWSSRVRGRHARYPDQSLTDWGPGDLKGLALLGREAGCLPAR